jgi:uncharacterized RDD family membrane protein YckC
MLKDIFWLCKEPSIFSRIGAKVVDLCLFYIVTTFFSLFLPFYIDGVYYLVFALFLPLFWMPVEAFLLSFFATTPGKKLFGIEVRTHIGTKLSYLVALRRAAYLRARPGLIRKSPLSTKRKWIAALVLIASVFTAAFEQELSDYSTGFQGAKSVDGWIDYTSQDGGFSILFPTDPQKESKLIPLPEQNRTLNYNELTSNPEKKISYSLSYMNLPKKWKLAGASRILQGALDGIVEHSDSATLVSKEYGKYLNYRSLDFAYSQDGQNVQGRLILVGTTLYRLTVTCPPAKEGGINHEQFFNSFDVHP